MNPPTARIPLDDMTSDQLDALYTERDELLAELGGRDEEAREAQAILQRVRALAERWRHTSDRKNTARPELLMALLDNPKEQWS